MEGHGYGGTRVWRNAGMDVTCVYRDTGMDYVEGTRVWRT